MSDNLIWLNLLTSGYSSKHNTILELAVVVTDKDYNVVNTLDVIPGWYPHRRTHFYTMDDDFREIYKENGLLEEINRSVVTFDHAAEEIYKFIQQYMTHETTVVYTEFVDKLAFLREHLPQVEALFHDAVDMSSLTHMYERWGTIEANRPEPIQRALPDLLALITEHKFYDNLYRNAAFIIQETTDESGIGEYSSK